MAKLNKGDIIRTFSKIYVSFLFLSTSIFNVKVYPRLKADAIARLVFVLPSTLVFT
jgi:hypothetical protein